MASPLPLSGWRKVVVNGLALAFALAGLVFGTAGVVYGLRTGNDDDILAGLFMGGCLLVIAVILFVAGRRAVRRRGVDMDTITAVGVAHMMTMHDDPGGGDFDGGDF